MSEEKFDIQKIKNVQLLLDYFGEMPSFHDADIKTMYLDRGVIDSDSNIYIDPSMEMNLDVVDWGKWVDKEAPFRSFENKVEVKLRFVSDEGFKRISYFQSNNEMDGISVDIEEPEGRVSNAWYRVRFWNHDSEEPFIDFKCNEIEVVSVEAK